MTPLFSAESLLNPALHLNCLMHCPGVWLMLMGHRWQSSVAFCPLMGETTVRQPQVCWRATFSAAPAGTPTKWVSESGTQAHLTDRGNCYLQAVSLILGYRDRAFLDCARLAMGCLGEGRKGSQWFGGGTSVRK